MMEWSQVIVILIPMIAGFGWAINKIYEVQKDMRQMDNRIARLEGYLEGRDVGLRVKGE